MKDKQSRGSHFWKATAAETDAPFIDASEAAGLAKARQTPSTITAREEAESNSRWARARLSAKLRGPVSLGEVVSLGLGAAAFAAFINYELPGQEDSDHPTRAGNLRGFEDFAAQKATMQAQGHTAKNFTWTIPTTEAGTDSGEGLQVARGSSFVPATLLRPLGDSDGLIPRTPLDGVTLLANRSWDVSPLGKASPLLDAAAMQTDTSRMLNSVDLVIAAADMVTLEQAGVEPSQAGMKLPDSTTPAARMSQGVTGEVMHTTSTDPNPIEAKQADRPWDAAAGQGRAVPAALKAEVDPVGRQPASPSSQTADAAAGKEPSGFAHKIGGGQSGGKAIEAQPEVWSTAAAGPTYAAKELGAVTATKGATDRTEATKAVSDLKIDNKRSDDASEQAAASTGTKFLATPSQLGRDADAPSVGAEVEQAASPTVTPAASGSGARTVPGASDKAVMPTAVPDKSVPAIKSTDQPGDLAKPTRALDAMTEMAKADHGQNAEALGQAGTSADTDAAVPPGKLRASTDHTKTLESMARVDAAAAQDEVSHAIHADMKSDHGMHNKAVIMDAVLSGTIPAGKTKLEQPHDQLDYAKLLNIHIVTDPGTGNKAKALPHTSIDVQPLAKAGADKSDSPAGHGKASGIIGQAEASDAAGTQPKISHDQSSDSIAQVRMGADTRATVTSVQDKHGDVTKHAKATGSGDKDVSAITAQEHATESQFNVGTGRAPSAEALSQAVASDTSGVSFALGKAKKDQSDDTTPPVSGAAPSGHAAMKASSQTGETDRFEFAGKEITSLPDTSAETKFHGDLSLLHQEKASPDWSADLARPIADDRSTGTFFDADHQTLSNTDLMIL
jgi:hypothetical protein